MPTPIDPFKPLVSGSPAALRLSRGRENVATIATLKLADGHVLHVRVRNISEGGLMAELPMSLPVDEPVEAEVPGLGALKGRIAWQAAGRTGVAFDELIDPRLARDPSLQSPQG